MSTCVYDNPNTMRREYWCDGELSGYFTAEFLDQASEMITITRKNAPNLQPFQPGAMRGDSTAMKKAPIS